MISPSPLTITNIIVGPGAPSGGRGTSQSPAALCGPVLPGARAGDVIDLLAGTHVCNDRIYFYVVGGSFAYRVTSELSFVPHSAVGTTLNGRSYAGQLLAGPATLAPDYDLPTETLTQL